MENKFLPVLEKRAAEIKKEEEIQGKLRQKYQVKDANVKIVEKNMFLQSVANVAGRLLRMICIIMIFILAAIGAIGICYPAPRNELIHIGTDIWNQLITFF